MRPLVKICERPRHQRPREKILSSGAGNMSDAECLALLLNSGSDKEDAISLASRLLNMSGGLRSLQNWTPEKLMEIHGIGPAKAAKIMALTSLFFRFQDEIRIQRPRITGPADLIPLIQNQLRDREREVFAVAFLDSAHQLIAIEELFEGGLNYATVSPRVVITRALDRRAAAVILVHNHPSGNPVPSREDHNLTQKIRKSLEFVEIKLLDHLLIAGNQTIYIR